MTRYLQIIFLFIVGCTTATLGQNKIVTRSVNDEVIYAAVDRPGELYVMTADGQIQKFDIDGNLLSVFKNNPGPTLFDPRDGARLFAYYRNDQHYVMMNPSFEVTASYKLDAAFVTDPWLICTAGDHNLWAIDVSGASLKKLNIPASSVDVDVKLDSEYVYNIDALTFMREYQGFLFVLNREKGILIFNSIGKLVKVIEQPDLSYFNFLGEELYYPRDGKIRFFNLFTAETHDMDARPGQFMLITDERIFNIDGKQIDFFALKP